MAILSKINKVLDLVIKALEVGLEECEWKKEETPIGFCSDITKKENPNEGDRG